MPQRVSFGPFELDLRSAELRKHGIKIRLHEQPFRVLTMLLSRPGEVVLREEIRQALWPDNTVVEFDQGINATIQRLRDALGDSAAKPRYVETLPRRGYRFIGPVQTTGAVITAAPSPPSQDETAAGTTGPETTPDRAAGRKWHIAGGLALVAFLAAGAWWAGRSHSSQPPKFERLTYRRGAIQSARFTPDGRAGIYAASWDGQPLDLFSVQFATRESRSLGVRSAGLLAIASTGQMAVSTNWSPLSTNYPATIADSAGTLAEMPLTGGAPREILERVQFADWTRDGQRLAVTIAAETGSRLEFPQGRVLYHHSGDGWAGDPRVAPDGESVAFIDHYYAGDDGSVAVVDSRGRKRTLTPVFDTVRGLAWSPGRKEIWFTAAEGGTGQRRLRAVTLSGAMRAVAQIPGNLKLHDIAADGRVLLSKEDSRSRIYFLGPGDSTPRDLTWLDWAIHPILSADGKILLMTENDESTGGKSVTYLRGTDGSPAIRLADNMGVALSPDGRWVVTVRVLHGQSDIVVAPVKAGAPIPIDIGSLKLVQGFYPSFTWLPDSEQILFSAKEPGRLPRIYVRNIRAGQARPVTPEGLWGGLLTADSTHVLVRDSRSNAFLFPLARGTPKPLPFLTSEYKALTFTADRTGIFVTKLRERPPRVLRMDLATGRSETWKEIPAGDPTVTVPPVSIRITPDGKSMAYTFRAEVSELYLVHGLH